MLAGGAINKLSKPRLAIYHHQVDAAQRTAKYPYQGQGREYSICSANEYRGQGRDNTEDKIWGIKRSILTQFGQSVYVLV